MGYTPPSLYLVDSSGNWIAYAPTSTSTKYLILKSNTTDTYPYLRLNGASVIGSYVQSSQEGAFYYYIDTTNYFQVSYATPDVKLASVIADKNIYLKTTGTGKIKVPGTATGTGDVAVNGHYDILDSLGATIKLATVA